MKVFSQLHATGLCKSYGGRTVLNQVSIRVAQGEAVGLLGPNGAGKTTCFSILAGLVQAEKGKIKIDKLDITNMPLYKRAREGLNYLPQEPSIFRGLNVEDNILAVLENIEPNRYLRKQILEEILEELSITHLRHSLAMQLSGGERRRVEIARARVVNSRFILLDEPLAGIDPIAVSDTRNMVMNLKNYGIGVLITDHKVRETLSMVDRVYIINNGQVMVEGTPQEIIDNSEVRRVYLGESFSL